MIITQRTIEKLKAKDEKTFEAVYNEFEKLVFYICYSVTYDKTASEDLTQDTFVKLLSSLDNYVEDGKFKSFLVEIARNLSLNYVTRVANRQVAIKEGDVPVEEYAAEDGDQAAKLTLELQGILEKEESEIVILKIVYDFKFREIAEAMNLTIGEAQSRYYKALEKVKAAYEKGGLEL